MGNALEGAGWPAAGCDSEGGLWVACRTFPTDDAPQPPQFEIQLATSWRGLRPETVARGLDLSTPALAIGCEDGEDRVTVAWTVGPGGHGGIRSRTVSRAGSSRDGEVPGVDVRMGIIGLKACADRAGRVWLAWQEVADRTSAIRVSRQEPAGWTSAETISDPDAPASVPALAPDPTGGLWVAWCRHTGQGFVPMLRHLTAEGVWEDPVAAGTGQEIDLDPSLDVDAQGRVFLAWKRAVPRWGTIPGYRFNEETHLYVRAYDPETGEWFALADQSDAPLPIPATVRFMPIAGRETLDHWAGPLSPRIFVDAAGLVHVLFRRYRDVHGVYDWGFDLCHTAWESGGWRDVALMSHTAGYPDGQAVPVRMADGGAALVYQYSNYAPVYWHCAGERDRLQTNITHSGIAIIRLPWGGKVPSVGRASPARPEALRPGVAEWTGAKPTSRPGLRAPAPARRTAKAEAIRSVTGTERCFHGDMHRHTDASKCMPNKDGTLWDHYRWARDLAGLDFYVITDHIEDAVPPIWGQILAAADAFDQPGSFAALYGIEYTNKVQVDGKWSDPQDLCFYMIERDVAWRVRHRLRHGPPGEQLVQDLGQPDLKGRVFLARHFHGGGGLNLDMGEPCNRLMENVSPDLEPVVEGVQFRGSAMFVVNELLQTGQRKGVIGGSDHGRPRWVYARATTGVWADGLSRGSIMSALFRRRCFATNGPHMVVDFCVGGAPMGSEMETAGAVQLTGFVQGTTPLKSLTVYRDGKPWQQVEVLGSRVDLSLADQLPPGSHFYWVYASQEPDGSDGVDGELWSSAVWLAAR